jgi:hypothetical protein
LNLLKRIDVVEQQKGDQRRWVIRIGSSLTGYRFHTQVEAERFADDWRKRLADNQAWGSVEVED